MPREDLIWAIQLHRESLMGQVVAIGPRRRFHQARRLMEIINRTRATPSFVYGPFWTKADAQRFLRRYHHSILGQTRLHRSSNPLRRICSWCKKVMGTSGSEKDTGDTHGICAECRAGLKVPKRKT